MQRFLILSVFIAATGNPVSSEKPAGNCSMLFDPPSVVVGFGYSFTVNCSTSSDLFTDIGLETAYGSTREYKQPFTTKTLTVTRWDISPICFVNLNNDDQCEAQLPVTIYKMPDSVSLTVPPLMDEGKIYEVMCAATNVAPMGYLSFILHRGNETQSWPIRDNSKTPGNVTTIFTIEARSDDNGTPLWCEARLDLKLTYRSDYSGIHIMSVQYSPTFFRPNNETLELSSSDGGLVLDCKAKGKPAPKYSWTFPHSIQHSEDQDSPVLVPKVQLPGTYRCTASNSQGSRSKFFTVINPPRNRTTFAALLGGFVVLGVVLLVAGYFLVTPQGTFSLNKGGYAKGTPTSS